MIVNIVTLVVIALTAVVVIGNYLANREMPKRVNSAMLSLGAIIRRGANLFMLREYRIIVPLVLLVALAMTLGVETWSGAALILGGCMSSASCILGMKSATYANVRTAHTAHRTRSIGKTVKTALRGGSVSGLSVQGFGLLGLVIVILLNYDGLLYPQNNGHGLVLQIACNPAAQRLFMYSLGCSLVALTNRVAGGNFTKAADISADIVAKNVHNLPEDDSRMPNTVADFIGDNVNDVAGNCSDLLESFVATVVSAILNANMQYQAGKISFESLKAMISYPVILAGCGLLSCVVAILITLWRPAGDKPSSILNLVTYISAGGTTIFGGIAASILFSPAEIAGNFAFGWFSPWLAGFCGIFSGVAIGKITEHYTGIDKRPVINIARFSREGEAFNVTKGDAVGERSCLAPTLVVALAIVIASSICGVYGIAIASVGMLSFVGAIVSIDAFGPIADNAGGIVESCELGEEVRRITDAADAAGNTTAAIGKGLAIGSAAFATISLMVTYVSSYTLGLKEAQLNIIAPLVIAGAIVGGAMIKYFSGILTDNTIDSAYKMAAEGERQLEIPGVLEREIAPDYDRVIKIASDEALRKMLSPSLLMLLTPVIGGMLFGAEFVGGILVGATIMAIPDAIFMGNSGGAFDNAKKYIESGFLEGCPKGSAAHKAAVSGDTVGDTRKDVVGVALDIGIKLMSTVANTLAPIFATTHLF